MKIKHRLEKEWRGYRKPKGWINEFGNTNSLFIHIPKTAGTAIAESFYGVDPWHYRIADYDYLSRSYFNSLFKFAFVRNPYFRLLSAYSYSFKQTEVHPKTSVKFVTKFNSFAEFVLNWITSENINEHYFFWPQTKYICNNEDEVLVDFCGKFENIEQDFCRVKQALGVDALLKESNVSKKSTDENLFDEPIVERIYNVYQRDFEVFGYDRESYATINS